MSKNILIYRIINYMNLISGSQLNPIDYIYNKDLLSLIDKKYNFDDFKKVIDKKWNQWKGTEFEKYVRPSTLFSEKFESYLNEQSNREAKISKLFKSIEEAKRANWNLD